VLIHHHGRTEIPSASSLRRWNSAGVNMWMYWKLLERAIEKGSREFDFGRSTHGSGTYKFKEQWGAKPHPAIWQYYVRKGDPSDMRPDSPTKVRFVNLWKKLPLWLTRLVGPSIVRGIP
ncbi:MAG: GNAT family N-acetyltransferase, partial [Pirellula sp.]